MQEYHLAPLLLDILKGSDNTVRRVSSATDYILKVAFDTNAEEIENLAKMSMDAYLNAGEEGRKRFLVAKMMAHSMLRLENYILTFHPEWLNNDISDEDLNKFLEDYHTGEEKHRLEFEITNRLLQKEDSTYQLDDGLATGTQLGEEIILKFLKTREYELEPDDEALACTICMEEFKTGETVAQLHYCEHEYHVNCIKPALFQRNRCPVCRTLAFPRRVEYPEWIHDWGKLRHFLRRVIA